MGVNLHVERFLVFRTTSSVESGDFDFREVPSIPRIAFTGDTLHHPPPICPSQNMQVQSAVFVYHEKYGHSEVGIGHWYLCKLKKIIMKKKKKKKKTKKKKKKKTKKKKKKKTKKKKKRRRRRRRRKSLALI